MARETRPVAWLTIDDLDNDPAVLLSYSRNKVKTQAMSICGKLQALSRGEPFERAVELGLLGPFPGLEPARRSTPG